MQNLDATNDLNFDLHIFVCTNKRDNKVACDDHDMRTVRDELKRRMALKYGKKVRVNSAGCLGHCSKGAVAVIYPMGHWLTHLTDKSIDELEALIDKYIEENKK